RLMYSSGCSPASLRQSRASPTTPMTTAPSALRSMSDRRRFPIGSCPGHNLLASDSLTSATLGALVTSLALNKRPSTSGIFSVEKYVGVTRRRPAHETAHALGEFGSSTGGRTTGAPRLCDCVGRLPVMPTLTTPGIAAMSVAM